VFDLEPSGSPITEQQKAGYDSAAAVFTLQRLTPNPSFWNSFPFNLDQPRGRDHGFDIPTVKPRFADASFVTVPI